MTFYNIFSSGWIYYSWRILDVKRVLRIFELIVDSYSVASRVDTRKSADISLLHLCDDLLEKFFWNFFLASGPKLLPLLLETFSFTTLILYLRHLWSSGTILAGQVGPSWL